MRREAKALGFRIGVGWEGNLHPTWLLELTLLPHAARQVVSSVLLYTVLTELQVFAAP